ncbi:MAG: hypothetical protein JXQ71_10625 [Verrucomicrobia bacterium]|nr:hypothetical protein [Verrucomicrobiota bacterium]
MNTNRTRNAVLTLAGAAALLAYVLACTSFSPDDSKVLFPAYDPVGGGLALAVYDRDKGSTDSLLTLPPPPDEDNLMRALWTPDGKRVVALWPDAAEEDTLRIMVLPFETREPVRVLSSPALSDEGTPLWMPPAIVGSRLFMGHESHVLRLDLVTGAVRTNTVQGEILLVGQGERVHYLRVLDDDASGDERFELGRLDLDALTCVPSFHIPKKHGQEINACFAVSRDGARLAFLRKEASQLAFLVYDDRALTRTLPLGGKTESLCIGNVRFSPDGSTLYATFTQPLPAAAGNEKAQQCGILEMPVDGAPSRRIPLFVVRGGSDEGEAYLFQLDVSHDGKTLAACSTYVHLVDPERLDPKDLGLYLVDLTAPDRNITKVPVAPPRVAPKPPSRRK